MPPRNKTKGLRCPVHGCGGICRYDNGQHKKYGKVKPWALTPMRCEKCDATFLTLAKVLVGTLQLTFKDGESLERTSEPDSDVNSKDAY